ncbi:MAG: zinc ABC transporter substrate-binding protein, partial [Dehalococcoidales bacterium]|nr:zinc ABC transporter substrate-binding protein [Dehalococcoidales bacterium]
MFKKIVLIASILSLGLIPLLAGSCTPAEEAGIKVVTSTSLIQYIVEQVGGSKVEVINVVPPNLHPGNFDVKVFDIKQLANAKLFILPGYPGESWAD